MCNVGIKIYLPIVIWLALSKLEIVVLGVLGVLVWEGVDKGRTPLPVEDLKLQTNISSTSYNKLLDICIKHRIIVYSTCQKYGYTYTQLNLHG